MAKDLNRSIKIFIDNSDAMKKSKDLEASMTRLRQKLQDLHKQGQKGSPEYIKTEKALQQLSTSYGRYQEKLKETERILNNLSGATEAQLLAVRRQLRQDLKQTIRNTDEYKAKLEALMAVEKELSVVEQEQSMVMGRKGSVWSSMADGFNKYFGIVTSFIAGITGISYTLRKLAEDVAQMDDVYADVMKTTGMTREEVIDLNETFKQMDTRTARDEINLLARDAGKLGLTSRKDILDFVEAGNQINVSLGEDLGEGAIKNIGKMTDVYALSTKELDKLDLKGKMLAIGSAINELGATSTANEAYMVNFAQRLGGVASQAGISIQNVLGYASALDQSGQAVEMSATALQKFIMTLMGDPAKFAKLAGLEVKEFNQLLKTDTNEAIKQVLTALSNKGGFQALIPIFKDMGLDGARAVGVLSALATNIDKVNSAQEVSNKAFADGTSVSDEYNIKNNNLQAQLEKSRKAFKDAALDLGERLNPSLLVSTKFLTHTIKLLPSIIDWFSKYKTILISASAGIITYTIALNKAIIAKKILVLWNERILQSSIVLIAKEKIHTLVTAASTLATYAKGLAHDVLARKITITTAAQELFRLSLMKTPWGLVISLIVAGGVALYQYMTQIKETITASKKLKNVLDEATRSIASEKAELDLLVNVAKNEKISKEERIKAIKKLNEISPEYLGNLSLENINTIEATKSIETYTEALLKNAQAKAIQGALEGDYARLNELKLERERIEEERGRPVDIFFGLAKVDYGDDDWLSYDNRERLKELQEEENQLNKNIKAYKSFYVDLHNQQASITLSEEDNLIITRQSFDELEQSYANLNSEIEKKSKNPFYTDFQKKQDENQLRLLGEQVNKQRELYKTKEKDYNISKKSKEFMLMSEGELKKIIATNGEYTKLASDIFKQRFSDNSNDTPSSSSGKGNTMASKQKKAFDLFIEQLETKHQEKLQKIKEQYRDGDITSESEYNQQLFSQEQAYSLLKEQTIEDYLNKIADKELRSDLTKQLATLRTKRLDDEINFRSKLQKIILDANPEAKELQEYENRLRDVGLYGIEKERLTKEQLDALELLEKQHQENVDRIRREAKRKNKNKGEEEFNEDFAERKEDLLQQISEEEQRVSVLNGIGALSPDAAFNAEVALQQKRIALLQEEVDARQKAGLDISKVQKKLRAEELNMTQLYVAEYNKRRQQYDQYATSIGTTIGNVLSGQQDAMASFGDAMIDIMFDIVSQIINTKIAEATAVALAEQAKAAAIAYALPDSVLSFGASGAVRSAAIGALIMGGLAVAKSALKGMLGKSKSSSTSSSSSSTTSGSSSGQITVKQRANGNYNVIGEEDGKLYKNIPYTGFAETGVVQKPVLVGEQGSELIVSAPDFLALRKHINYPLVVEAIQESRQQPIRQRANGKYDNLDSLSKSDSLKTNPVEREMLDLLRYLKENGVQSKVNFGVTEYQAELKKRNDNNKLFSKK